MASPHISAGVIDAYRSNFNFTVSEDKQEHLLRCWAQSTCGECLNTNECSWCPFTWACVPNSFEIPLLAPAYDDFICPHPAEQWELRSRPLGCKISSLTSVTVLASVAATLLLVAVLIVLAFAVPRARQYSKQYPNWTPIWRSKTRLSDAGSVSQERDPLLPSQEGNHAGGA